MHTIPAQVVNPSHVGYYIYNVYEIKLQGWISNKSPPPPPLRMCVGGGGRGGERVIYQMCNGAVAVPALLMVHGL
jgi:hypothetical protein